MSKSNRPEPTATAVQDEAMAVARGIQKPGQTKEQTRLIAQGIAKGIEQYKRQQSAKARERDKARKRLDKQRHQAAAGHGAPLHEDAEDGLASGSDPVMALRVAAWLFTLMALLHGLRLLAGWPVVIAGWNVPAWLSGLAVPLLATLAFWLFRGARRLC